MPFPKRQKRSTTHVHTTCEKRIYINLCRIRQSTASSGLYNNHCSISNDYSQRRRVVSPFGSCAPIAHVGSKGYEAAKPWLVFLLLLPNVVGWQYYMVSYQQSVEAKRCRQPIQYNSVFDSILCNTISVTTMILNS